MLPLIIGVFLIAVRRIVASTADTCNGITLKCASPKTAIAGKKANIHITLSNKGSDLIDNISVGIDFEPNQLYYAKSKVSASIKKVTSPDVTSDTRISWYESLGPIQKKKSANFEVIFDVDPCAQPEQYISAYASAGDCDLQLDCHPVGIHI